MRIIIATAGTFGDHLPMVGLAVALKQHKYEVQIACNEAMHPLAIAAGVTPTKLGTMLGQKQATKQALSWDQWIAPPELMTWSNEIASIFLYEAEELFNILHKDDILIGTRNLPFLSLIAKARQCRWVQVGLNSGAMIDDEQMSEKLNHNHPWKQGMETLEKKLHNRLISGLDDYQNPQPLLRLHAVPQMFVPLKYPQLNSIRTGFWCWEDPRWKEWSPPINLKYRLLQDRATMALAFSSQPVINPIDVISQHLKVAEIMKKSLIVVKGWAFHSQSLPPKIKKNPYLVLVDPLPFSWLFQRVDIVFIHGGIGTFAEALRAGCRVVIEPHGNDQFLNALIALENNLALIVHPHRFNPTEVAEYLNEQPRTNNGFEEKDFGGIAIATQELLNVL